MLPAECKGQNCFRRRVRGVCVAGAGEKLLALLPPAPCSSPAWLSGSVPTPDVGQGGACWAAHAGCTVLLEAEAPYLSRSQAGALWGGSWSSLGLQRLAIAPGSTWRCAAAAPNCSFLSKRERKSISAKSRLGLCLKPLSKEPCLNVIAPLLLQGENTLYCSLFLGKLG